MQLLRCYRSGRALVLLPLGLIAAVCVVDVLTPREVHLGPLLVAAPAVTAAFAGPRLTALIGALAVGAQLFIGAARGTIGSQNIQVQVAALVIVSGLIVLFRLVLDRRERQLSQSRTVARAVQEVLLPPLPERSGPLRMAGLYLAAQDEAALGGDLYAAARTEDSTRLLIADVRGKGLPAIDHAALLLGAFRAASHRRPTLPWLAAHLDGAMRWDSRQWHTEGTPDTEEAFATALLLDIPDREEVVRFVNCGHPDPVLICCGRAEAHTLVAEAVAPPLGIGPLSGSVAYAVASFAFSPGDELLLHTDGVLEARDADGAFFPLAARAVVWAAARPTGTPDDLLRRLRDDLLAHACGRLRDDMAAVAISRPDR
ncbi:PP2C family protein-serine/threonine phosphatase [Streptomyces sp. NPDC015220]|uniref:PP2C family protein-serine/threonine phosphatase n=1 Tax=Streptomyces sp. NPDC015220 TaxID=3364947 RepID=UPI0036FB9DB6